MRFLDNRAPNLPTFSSTLAPTEDMGGEGQRSGAEPKATAQAQVIVEGVSAEAVVLNPVDWGNNNQAVFQVVDGTGRLSDQFTQVQDLTEGEGQGQPEAQGNQDASDMNQVIQIIIPSVKDIRI